MNPNRGPHPGCRRVTRHVDFCTAMRWIVSPLAVMCKRLGLLVILFLPQMLRARDKPENWVEVRSPHFAIVSNSNEKRAVREADQFERMRSVFHTLFPKVRIDTGSPITVLAIKDEKDFRALEPA